MKLKIENCRAVCNVNNNTTHTGARATDLLSQDFSRRLSTTMVKRTVYFTVVAVVNFILADAATTSDRTIQNLLLRLKQKLKQEQDQYQPEERELVEDVQESGAGGAGGYYGSIGAKELSRLLGVSSPSPKKYRSDESGGYEIEGRNFEKYLQSRRPDDDDVYGNNNDVTSVFKLSAEDNRDDENNSNEYSKVYVVLNSDTIKTTKNKDKLNKLLSGLLSSNDNREQKNEFRYKGFVVNEEAQNRRISHDSTEIFEKEKPVPKKQLRHRDSYYNSGGRGGGGRGGGGRGGSGGGGGGGGSRFESLRTPIPYIHHRDDNIYERVRF